MSDHVGMDEIAEDGAVSAYVPDLAMILVTGRDRGEAREAVRKGIRLDREEMALIRATLPDLCMRHEVVSV